jgi:hypothetical protein
LSELHLSCHFAFPFVRKKFWTISVWSFSVLSARVLIWATVLSSTTEVNSIDIESILASGLIDRLINICAGTDSPFSDLPFLGSIWADASALIAARSSEE